MNFIIRNLFLIFVLLCAVACSSDENFNPPSLENIDFRVSLAGQSRVVIRKDGSGDFQVGMRWLCGCMNRSRISFRIKRCYIAKEIGGLLPYIGKTGKGLLIFMRSGLQLLR